MLKQPEALTCGDDREEALVKVGRRLVVEDGAA